MGRDPDLPAGEHSRAGGDPPSEAADDDEAAGGLQSASEERDGQKESGLTTAELLDSSATDAAFHS